MHLMKMDHFSPNSLIIGLNSLDFLFLWEFVKDIVSVPSLPRDLQELQECIAEMDMAM